MSTAAATSDRLDRPVDDAYDHVLGLSAAPLTLVEYGSYACPYCRAANEPIAELRDRFGDRLRYVFRHRPVSGSDLARRAADLAECAGSQRGFWDAHVELMTRSEMLTEDDLRAVAEDLALESKDPERIAELSQRSRERVDADIESARRSGVRVTPPSSSTAAATTGRGTRARSPRHAGHAGASRRARRRSLSRAGRRRPACCCC
jgi:Na+:H+ antiporter, NhaA family